MRTSNIAPTTPFNKKEIIAKASLITASIQDGIVTTKHGDVVVSTYKPTEAYELVNFSDAVKQLLNVVEKIYKPTTYALTVHSGFQELKLQGEKHVINGDVFHEMMWLTNSTNGSRRLSVRYGLMRQICSNGACVTEAGSSFKIKHLVSHKVNEELRKFMLSLPTLNVMNQVKALKKIGKKKITVREVIQGINPDNKLVESSVWNLLVKKFTSSKTDALGSKDDALITGINVPVKKMTKEILDAEIPAWGVFNCYTELWRSLDASGIERETNKILAVLS